MRQWIDATVKRRGASRAKTIFQREQRRAAGIAQHQVEIREPARADIIHRLAAADLFERNRCVEIVEYFEGRRWRDQLRRRNGVMTKRGNYSRIGIGNLPLRFFPDAR